MNALNLLLLIIRATTALIVTVNLAFVHSENVLKSPNLLSKSEIIQLNGAVGPESVAFHPNGQGPYIGVADGRILKWQQAQSSWADFAVTSPQRTNCTLPLLLKWAYMIVGPNGGLATPLVQKFQGKPLVFTNDVDIDDHKDVIYFTETSTKYQRRHFVDSGELYIADAYFGLQVVGPNGGLATPLVQKFQGKPLVFTNDVDIDDYKDVIYFTETSTKYQRRHFVDSLSSGDATGRLMKYDKLTKRVTVLLGGLAFANGVALSKDRSFVLVAETSNFRIVRYWLKGPLAGTHDTFAELPGFPDNIRINSKGEFWVALQAINSVLEKKLQLEDVLGGGQLHASAIRLSEEGRVMEVLEDVEGKTLRSISEVEEKHGKLWFGSVVMPFLGVYGL
ncbi:hypothetical protein HAX54_019720 [Datura stramonium]|uniref:Strictosidine synthase conserved region domain-containing protein n=1 Tax=Datura stramonium TaxID=4076 RepID=A0ABS8URR5_DATST|nr:hypothetical protein [Datura stramonium]